MMLLNVTRSDLGVVFLILNCGVLSTRWISSKKPEVQSGFIHGEVNIGNSVSYTAYESRQFYNQIRAEFPDKFVAFDLFGPLIIYGEEEWSGYEI